MPNPVFWQSERAARKATILQMATIYTVIGGTLLNLGVTLSSQGSQVFANGSFVGAGEHNMIYTSFHITNPSIHHKEFQSSKPKVFCLMSLCRSVFGIAC